MTVCASTASLTTAATARLLAATIAQRLAAAGVTTPEADARWLIEGIAGVDPWREPDAVVAPTEALAAAVARRELREPLQLIVGETAFLDLTVACRPGVFVPRPETEVLARLAIDALGGRPSPVVIEPCTGSGVLACAVARHVPGVRVIAVDCDPAAVELASANARRVLAASVSTIDVLPGDLFAPVTASLAGHVDLVVANPPYLPPQDVATWDPEVADHDPRQALIGGDDGHEIVARIVTDSARWLRPDGIVMLEIDARRADEVAALAADVGWRRADLVDDLAGWPRFVVLRGPPSAAALTEPTSRTSKERPWLTR